MTGRKGRVVSTKDGVQYESRSEVDVRLEILNLTEKQRFMDGDKVCLSVCPPSRCVLVYFSVKYFHVIVFYLLYLYTNQSTKWIVYWNEQYLLLVCFRSHLALIFYLQQASVVVHSKPKTVVVILVMVVMAAVICDSW